MVLLAYKIQSFEINKFVLFERVMGNLAQYFLDKNSFIASLGTG